MREGDLRARGEAARGAAVTIGVGLVLVAPLALLLPRALADAWRAPAVLPQQWGLRGVDVALSPGNEVLAATRNSLLVAVGTTAVALLLAWPAARALGRLPRGRRAPVFALLLAPLLVPPYATGTGLVAWLLRLGLADSLVGIGAAHLPYVLPYVLLALLPAFGRDLDALEEAARSSGAGCGAALWHVVLPSARAPLATALLLGVVVSWSQVGTSLAAGGGVPMLPVVALPFSRRDPQVAAVLDLLLLVPPLVALVVSRPGGGSTGGARAPARPRQAPPRARSR